MIQIKRTLPCCPMPRAGQNDGATISGWWDWAYIAPMITAYVLLCAGIMLVMNRADAAARAVQPVRRRVIARRRFREDER